MPSNCETIVKHPSLFRYLIGFLSYCLFAEIEVTIALSLDPTSIPHTSTSQILGLQICTIKARFSFKFRSKCHPWLQSLRHLAPPTSSVLLPNDFMCCLSTLATAALSLQWSLVRGLGTGVFAWLISLLPSPSQQGSSWLWSRTRIVSYRNRCPSEVLHQFAEHIL